MPTTHRLVSKAKAVADVWTFTPTASNSQTYTITCNEKDISFTADSSATVAEITAGLVALLSSTADPPPPAEFLEYEWTDATTLIRATAITAGVPGTFTSSASGGGALVASNSTPASGPYFANVADNYDSGAVPVTGDTLYVDLEAQPLLYGLAQSGVVLAALYIRTKGGTWSAGLPNRNSAGYTEYRKTKWEISATALTVDSDSSRIKINLGSNVSAVNVLATGESIETGVGALVLLGTNASNTLDASGGSIDIAPFGGEVSTFATVTVSNATVRCGAGVTLGSWESSGGSADLEPLTTMSSITARGGAQVTLKGSATITDVFALDGSTVFLNGSNTLTDAAATGGAFELGQDTTPLTVGNITFGPGGQWNDPHNRTNLTGGMFYTEDVKSISAS